MTNTLRRKKVILLHYIPTPYRVYLFNKINEYYHLNNIQFKVFFLSEGDKNRHWKKFDFQFDYEILKPNAIRLGKKDLYTFFINLNILSKIKSENPDKIICFGWDNLAAYFTNYWARKNKREFVLWSGSTEYEKSWRRVIFNPLVKYIVHNATWCVGDGTRHKEYLLKLGSNAKKTEKFIIQIDINLFNAKLATFTKNEKKNLKVNLGVTTTKLFLFNGQFIERKGVHDLLEGFEIYQKYDMDASLLFLGTGQEEENLLKRVNQNFIKNVFFHSFVQYEEVYKYFAISDLLILPSREEAWGLVINEALTCGLPVITTNKVGASADLIHHGENGYVIPSHSPADIAEAIARIFENKLNVVNKSKEIISSFDTVKMIDDAVFLKF